MPLPSAGGRLSLLAKWPSNSMQHVMQKTVLLVILEVYQKRGKCLCSRETLSLRQRCIFDRIHAGTRARCRPRCALA